MAADFDELVSKQMRVPRFYRASNELSQISTKYCFLEFAICVSRAARHPVLAPSESFVRDSKRPPWNMVKQSKAESQGAI